MVRWERFHFNPYPTQQEFDALAEVVGVEVERLWEMLPPMGGGDEVRTDSGMWCLLCRVALSSD